MNSALKRAKITGRYASKFKEKYPLFRKSENLTN
jgi:hypothetical protein